MQLKAETIQIQSQLADYCRTGVNTSIKGTKSGRLPTYRRLVYNVVDGALEQAYPISHAVLSENEWKELVNAFFTGHNSQSNQVWQMPHEFLQFVVTMDYSTNFERPYLNDLLLFEWMEIEVFCMKDGEIPDSIKKDWNENDVLFINPDAAFLQLAYPVHKYSVEELSGKKGEYHLLIFRHTTTGIVHFIEISSLFSEILKNCSSGTKPLIEVISKVFNEFNLEQSSDYLSKTLSFINSLQESGAVLGSVN